MSPTICWSDLADTSVGVWGLGVEGAASLRKLRSLGVAPILVDDTPAGPSQDGLEVLATDGEGLDALLRCDVVVKSPGISRYRPEVARLQDAGVAVRGGLGLWLEEVDRTAVVCITGTKGKSTTTALCVHLLGRLGHHAAAGGNIGRPPWDPAQADDQPDYWIIETSSFQVPDLSTAPPIVAVTSLSPDHLDWHGSVERYYADKLSLCTKPGVELALVEGSSPELRAQQDALGPHLAWVDDGPPTLRNALSLPGPHNARNAQMAYAVLRALGAPGAEDDERLAAAAQGFAGLPSRCVTLGHIEGIEFVDDSLSTNVLPRPGCAGCLCRPPGGTAGGRQGPWPRLRPPGPDRRRAQRPHLDCDLARQRASYR